MREIGFDTDIMNNEVKNIRDELEVARTMIEKTYVAMGELDAMWEGIANEAFRTAFARDQEGMYELCETIEEITQSMQESKDDYRKSDEEVNELVQSLS
ncbi:MAG: WXG100 family type VII secretion target [Lachnospiraceae bacterium]|nr:WXG100 family type VII secretion target [Lachnospiraceae bacterium]